MAGSHGKRARFEIDLLDAEDPFEVDDGNRIHLVKHLPEDDRGKPVAVNFDDILDVYLYGDPSYFEASEDGEADWLMVGLVPGLTICVPLAPPNTGDARRCRPIGVYKPSEEDRRRYERGETDG